MTIRFLHVLPAFGLLVTGACLEPVPLYCDETKPCTDYPDRPFCDITGEYGGQGNTCIADPFDAGVEPEADGSPSDAGPGPEKIVEVAAGYHHTCARTNRGRVRCWGEKSRLGYEASENIGDDEFPRDGEDVPLPEPAIQLSASSTHTCAVTQSHRVICWGGNGFGGSGGVTQGGNTPPTEYVDIGDDVASVASGTNSTCAILANGAVRCWGGNYYGQLGIASTEPIGDDEPIASAPLVDLPGPAVQLAGGAGYFCATLEGGQLTCWGRGDNAVLGLEHTRHMAMTRRPETGASSTSGWTSHKFRSGRITRARVARVAPSAAGARVSLAS